MSCFSAAALPYFRGFDLKAHSDFPHIAAWFAAIEQRPTYKKVRSDEDTIRISYQRRAGLRRLATPGG